MAVRAGIFPRIKARLVRLSIFRRIIIGNAFIIVFGAVIGTLVTRYLAIRAADIYLILVFAIGGISLSVVINSLIVRTALKPLSALRQRVDAVKSNRGEIKSNEFRHSDPDLYQLAIAIENLIIELEYHNRRLRALSEQVINAQEDERKRIARSLHDDTGQSLTTLIFNLERLENKVLTHEPELQSNLVKARQLASRCLTGLRKIILGLRPSILDDLGLVPAIRWYARSHLEEVGIRVDIQTAQEKLPLPTRTTTTLFRITQEAVNNIVRHSKATQATISLNRIQDNVILRVEDNGCGFFLDEKLFYESSAQNWGLIGIRERAELVGGEMRIESSIDNGTRLEIRIPLPGSRDKERDGSH